MVEYPAAANGKPRTARQSALPPLEAGLIKYTFGFPGAIAPGNPNECDQTPWMPDIEYDIQCYRGRNDPA